MTTERLELDGQSDGRVRRWIYSAYGMIQDPNNNGRMAEFVDAPDYDALAARLAEAERLLDNAEDALCGIVEPLRRGRIIEEISAFLRTPDSARLVQGDKCPSE